jgi:hypothetical protein
LDSSPFGMLIMDSRQTVSSCEGVQEENEKKRAEGGKLINIWTVYLDYEVYFPTQARQPLEKKTWGKVPHSSVWEEGFSHNEEFYKSPKQHLLHHPTNQPTNPATPKPTYFDFTWVYFFIPCISCWKVPQPKSHQKEVTINIYFYFCVFYSICRRRLFLLLFLSPGIFISKKPRGYISGMNLIGLDLERYKHVSVESFFL